MTWGTGVGDGQAAVRWRRCGSLRNRLGAPSILQIRQISFAGGFIRPVSQQSIRTSPNMSCNHFRDSGDRKNSSLRIARGMPY